MEDKDLQFYPTPETLADQSPKRGSTPLTGEDSSFIFEKEK